MSLLASQIYIINNYKKSRLSHRLAEINKQDICTVLVFLFFVYNNGSP